MVTGVRRRGWRRERIGARRAGAPARLSAAPGPVETAQYLGDASVAALAASCAFMLPVATAPNAIIYASGEVTIAQMARAGFWLNIVGIFIVSTLSYFLVPIIFLP